MLEEIASVTTVRVGKALLGRGVDWLTRLLDLSITREAIDGVAPLRVYDAYMRRCETQALGGFFSVLAAESPIPGTSCH